LTAGNDDYRNRSDTARRLSDELFSSGERR
jgi:hypothetical protein